MSDGRITIIHARRLPFGGSERDDKQSRVFLPSGFDPVVTGIGLFVGCCIVLGGSSMAGYIANATLQTLAVFIIATSILYAPGRPLAAMQRTLLGVLVAVTLVPALQLIPMPPSWWSRLGGRDSVVAGLTLLGGTVEWMPITLDRDATVRSLLSLLVPAAVIVAMQHASERRLVLLVGIVLFFAVLAVGLAGLQLAAGPSSRLYLYRFSSWNDGVGFFSNANHFGTLCIMLIPLTAAVGATAQLRQHERRLQSPVAPVSICTIVVLIGGVAASGSRFGWILLLPVLAVSSLILWKKTLPAWATRRPLILGVGLLASVASITFLTMVVTRPIGGSDDKTRAAIWRHTLQSARNFGVLGAGLGTFPAAYARVEPLETVTDTYINRGHNDYLELVQDSGLLGLLAATLSLAWFGWNSVQIWRDPGRAVFPRAATVAIAVVIIHSIVDYPARTAAISALIALAAAIMASPRTVLEPERHLREQVPRHIRIGDKTGL